MFDPQQMADVAEGFQEFLLAGGQTCAIWRPAEDQDSLGATTRSFPTLIDENVPCVVNVPDIIRGMQYGTLGDVTAEESSVEILLPLNVNVNIGDQIRTEDRTFSVRKLDEADTHQLVQHVWGVIYARTA